MMDIDDLDLRDIESIADEVDELADRINQTLINYTTVHKADPAVMSLNSAMLYLRQAEDKLRFLL